MKGKIVDATGVELKPVRLELPEEVHYWLRVEAAKNKMSMAAYARKLIEDAKGRTKPRRGGERRSDE